MFHGLRTQADAILVGAGTVRIERYGRAIKSEELRARREAEGLEPDPLVVIVSGRLDLPPDLPILGEPEARVVIATGAEHELEGVAAQVTYLRTGDDLALMLAQLRSEHGVRSVLCEGGPTLNCFLLAAGVVDELFLTLSPQIVGGAAGPDDRGRPRAARSRRGPSSSGSTRAAATSSSAGGCGRAEPASRAAGSVAPLGERPWLR